jgi:hypothetical protein
MNGSVYKIKQASSRAINSVKHKERELKLLLDMQQKRMAVAEGMKLQNDTHERMTASRRERNRGQKEQVWAAGQKAAEFTRARNQEAAKQARIEKQQYAEKSMKAFDVHESVKEGTRQEREIRRQKKEEFAAKIKSTRTGKLQDRDQLRQRWRQAYNELHDENAQTLVAKRLQIEEDKKTRCVPSNTLRADRQDEMKAKKSEDMKTQLRERAAWMKRTVFASYADSLKQVKQDKDEAIEKKTKAEEVTLALDRKIAAAKAQLGVSKQSCRATSKQFLR